MYGAFSPSMAEEVFMPYGKCKIYSDGSHYIAIPHTVNPHGRRRKEPVPGKK